LKTLSERLEEINNQNTEVRTEKEQIPGYIITHYLKACNISGIP